LGCSDHGGESVPPDPMRTGSSRVAHGTSPDSARCPDCPDRAACPGRPVTFRGGSFLKKKRRKKENGLRGLTSFMPSFLAVAWQAARSCQARFWVKPNQLVLRGGRVALKYRVFAFFVAAVVLCDVRDVGALIPNISLLQFGVSGGARAMSRADDGTSAVGPSTSNKKGRSKAKRKPMDEDRWV
jgi:hypothetical protein